MLSSTGFGPIDRAISRVFGAGMKLRVQIAITTVLAASLAGAWMWLGGPEDSAQSREKRGRSGGATRVLVEPLKLAEDRVVVRAVGTGDALKSASIHPSVAGEVMEVAFSAEQRVKKGDVLLRLDDEHQKLAVRLIKVELDRARREANRLSRLARSGHASRARLETAQAALQSASVRHSQANANLADRTVVAPFDGIIGLTDLSVGDRVDDDTMIATLDDRSVILVDFNLPEDYASRVRVGDPIRVRPSTMRDRVLQGTISATGSRIDPASRSLRVRGQIPNPEDTIRPGTSFEVELSFTAPRLSPGSRGRGALEPRRGLSVARQQRQGGEGLRQAGASRPRLDSGRRRP